MSNFDLEIQNDFLTEAAELLDNTEKCFLALEKDPSNVDTLNEIFRLAHNLKGSSGAVGFSDLAEFTHKLETLLLALKEQKLSVSKAIVDLLLRTNDYLADTVTKLRENPAALYKNQYLSNELVQALSADANAPVQESAAWIDAESVGEHVISVTTGGARRDHPPAQTNRAQAPKEENIRVSLARIEKLLNNVGELSILQAVMVQQAMTSASVLPQLMRDTLSSMTKIIKDTQNISMGLRMIAIKQTFQKMERIVRDTSQAMGKEVDFHLSGEETEIDKTVLEQLSDPLIHIVRNAVDHGLESNEERIAAGKPARGQIHMSASHRAGQIVIEIREDGRGLNAAKIIAKAMSKGIISNDAVLTDEQAHQLIFAPGFSTKEVVTDVSGRGVGMDVVRTNILALQGNVEIETEIGKGTCFRIRLPLTLAIIDSIVIRLDDERYVIPLSQVSEFFRPQEQDINHLYDRNEVLTLRDEPLVVLRLSNLLGRKSETKPAWNFTSLIVRDGSNQAAAILVDRIVAQQQVVIKPLGLEMKSGGGLIGSAILGDGKPALILDLFELMKKTDIKRKHLGHETKQGVA